MGLELYGELLEHEIPPIFKAFLPKSEPESTEALLDIMKPLLRYLSKGCPEILMRELILSQYGISLSSLTGRILAGEVLRTEGRAKRELRAHLHQNPSYYR